MIFAFLVMAAVILLFAGAVEYIAMPALAGLLIVIGIETVKPHDIRSVHKTGSVQGSVMALTFVLTLLIPLQFAVVIGVGMSATLYVFRQANKLETRRLVVRDDGRIEEVDPPTEVPAHDVVVLQPYGSLFFAAAPVLEQQLPTVTEESVGSVVILRFRGKPDVGSTLIDILTTYAESLDEVGSKLMIVTDSDRIVDQLERTGATEHIAADDIYPASKVLLAGVIQAASDAQDWVTAQLDRDDTPIEETPIADVTIGDLATDATFTFADESSDSPDASDSEPADGDADSDGDGETTGEPDAN